MVIPRLDLTRDQILAYRRTVSALDERLRFEPDALRTAAWAGLQDSMPRAALLSLHARVEGVEPSTWEDPSLVQLWGPRFSAYVVAARRPGRLLARAVAGRRQGPAVGRGPGRSPRRVPRRSADDRRRRRPRPRPPPPERAPLRRARPAGSSSAGTAHVDRRSGRSRRPTSIRRLPASSSPAGTCTSSARRRRPRSPSGPASRPPEAATRSTGSVARCYPSRTPVGDAWVLASDEPAFRAPAGPAASRAAAPERRHLLPPPGADRELLVPEADRRAALWTPRVWPGAVLVGGDVVGTWRRAGGRRDDRVVAAARPGRTRGDRGRGRRPCHCPASRRGSASVGRIRASRDDAQARRSSPMAARCSTAGTK